MSDKTPSSPLQQTAGSLQTMDPLAASARRLAVSLGVLVLAGALFVRMAVSLHPYSGAGKPPMFGDYEAQRHWMEITYNLPIGEWYVNSSRNNLLYWGLDYPPLTAYHSWVVGVVAARLNPNWVALNASRGHESYEHKLFMRYTVIVADVAIYFTAIFVYTNCVLFRGKSAVAQQATLVFLTLLQPALVLIDHGHFQYNCISLGLTLWGIVAVVTHRDILGAIAFSLALNYKQMELYHAVPFFCFLLGKALHSETPLRKIISLGTTVMLTFAVCWLPFVTTPHLVPHVLHRLFPFERGLYEDKVANFWCSMSVVIKVRQLLSQATLVKLSLVSTLLALLPSSWNLLRNPTSYRFILALVTSSLSFFLFSFQVHEKSILLAVLPVTLLTPHHPHTSTWFILTSTFSMYPLLTKDGLALATWALSGLFYVCSQLLLVPSHKPHWTARAVFAASIGATLIICGLSHVISPPARLPDIFPVLISTFSCANFTAFLIYFVWLQLTTTSSSTYENVIRPINIEQKQHTE